MSCVHTTEKGGIMNTNLKSPIFAIDRLRMGTDGRGIPMLVCFMGCPLRCAYCMNDRCHEAVYEADGRTPRKGVMMLTPQELYDRMKIDNLYFQATGGGICFGGGEPMLYPEFIEEFRTICGNKWKITVETSLYGASYNVLERLANVVDQWIVDVKSMDSFIYERYTGRPSYIEQSLACLTTLGIQGKVQVKVPLIPDYNDEDDVTEAIRKLRSRGFNNVKPTTYVKRISKYPPNTEKP